jgi:hypothetical protein
MWYTILREDASLASIIGRFRDFLSGQSKNFKDYL